MAWYRQGARSGTCSSRRSMGLWARKTARKSLFCNQVMVIGEVEDIKRKYYMPQFFHFKNQQSSLDNHHLATLADLAKSSSVPSR